MIPVINKPLCRNPNKCTACSTELAFRRKPQNDELVSFISDADKPALIRWLAACEDGDYFERGIELMIENEHCTVVPLDITDLFAVEVDFEEDLTRANRRH